MLESAVERYLCKRMREAGGECLKFVSPARRHVNDRICIFPGGELWFIETKRPKAKPRPGQQRFHARLTALRQLTAVLDTREKIDRWLESDPDVWRDLL